MKIENEEKTIIKIMFLFGVCSMFIGFMIGLNF